MRIFGILSFGTFLFLWASIFPTAIRDSVVGSTSFVVEASFQQGENVVSTPTVALDTGEHAHVLRGASAFDFVVHEDVDGFVVSIEWRENTQVLMAPSFRLESGETASLSMDRGDLADLDVEVTLFQSTG